MGDVAAPSGAYRYQTVFRFTARLIELPLALLDVSVVVEIGILEPVRSVVRRRLARRQLSFMIFVLLPESLAEFRYLAAWLLIAARFPAGDVDPVAVDERHAFELPCHAAHPPQFLARLDGVRGHLK